MALDPDEAARSATVDETGRPLVAMYYLPDRSRADLTAPVMVSSKNEPLAQQ